MVMAFICIVKVLPAKLLRGEARQKNRDLFPTETGDWGCARVEWSGYIESKTSTE